MNKIEFGDCRETMRKWAEQGIKAQTCVTSPPYFGLRDYGHEGQIGLEETPQEYITEMVEVFRCVRDVLADDGTLWLNIGDSYVSHKPRSGSVHIHAGIEQRSAFSAAQKAVDLRGKGGLKDKDLIGIPWMLAFALRADGWYLRQDIIWHKPNPMPESVRDRCTKSHEYIFLLSKSQKYFFDSEAMKEPAIGGTPGNTKPTKGGRAYGDGASEHRTAANLHNIGARETRNRRSVWSVATKPYKGAHFATYPEELITPCILAGSKEGDIVLDPFMGSGTTAAVAVKNKRKYIGCELNEDYKSLQDERIAIANETINGKTHPEVVGLFDWGNNE